MPGKKSPAGTQQPYVTIVIPYQADVKTNIYQASTSNPPSSYPEIIVLIAAPSVLKNIVAKVEYLSSGQLYYTKSGNASEFGATSLLSTH